MIRELEIPLTLGTGRTVRAQFTEADGRELAVVLPGFRYGHDGPLLKEVTNVFGRRGVDLMQVEFTYASDPDFLNARTETQITKVMSDGQDIVTYALTFGNYARVWVIGKSLGAACMGAALSKIDYPSDLIHGIWLTPNLVGTQLPSQLVEQKYRSLVVLGSEDPSNIDKLTRVIKKSPHITLCAVSGVDHTFDHIEGSDASCAAIKHAKRLVASWAGRIIKDAPNALGES